MSWVKIGLPSKGLVLHFPEGMSDEDMRSAILQNFYPEKWEKEQQQKAGGLGSQAPGFSHIGGSAGKDAQISGASGAAPSPDARGRGGDVPAVAAGGGLSGDALAQWRADQAAARSVMSPLGVKGVAELRGEPLPTAEDFAGGGPMTQREHLARRWETGTTSVLTGAADTEGALLRGMDWAFGEKGTGDAQSVASPLGVKGVAELRGAAPGTGTRGKSPLAALWAASGRAGRTLSDAAQGIQERTMRGEDPGMVEAVGQALGSSAAFLVPAWASGAVLRGAGHAGKAVRFMQALIAAAPEALVEGNAVRESMLSKGVAEGAASRAGLKAFAANLPLNFVTDFLGVFGDDRVTDALTRRITGERVKKAAQVALSSAGVALPESAQETAQATISRWAEGEDLSLEKLKEDFRAEGIPAAISALLIGGVAGLSRGREARRGQEVIDPRQEAGQAAVQEALERGGLPSLGGQERGRGGRANVPNRGEMLRWARERLAQLTQKAELEQVEEGGVRTDVVKNPVTDEELLEAGDLVQALRDRDEAAVARIRAKHETAGTAAAAAAPAAEAVTEERVEMAPEPEGEPEFDPAAAGWKSMEEELLDEMDSLRSEALRARKAIAAKIRELGGISYAAVKEGYGKTEAQDLHRALKAEFGPGMLRTNGRGLDEIADNLFYEGVPLFRGDEDLYRWLTGSAGGQAAGTARERYEIRNAGEGGSPQERLARDAEKFKAVVDDFALGRLDRRQPVQVMTTPQPIRRGDVVRAFRTALVDDLGDGAFRVRLPRGELTVTTGGTIVVNESAAVAAGYSPEQVRRGMAVGRTVTAPDGRMSVTLTDEADLDTLAHEVYHVFEGAFATPQEVAALSRETGAETEEARAAAFSEWAANRRAHVGSTARRVWQKIADVLARVRAWLRTTAGLRPKAADVFREVESGRVWGREPRVISEERFSLDDPLRREPERKGSDAEPGEPWLYEDGNVQEATAAARLDSGLPDLLMEEGRFLSEALAEEEGGLLDTLAAEGGELFAADEAKAPPVPRHLRPKPDDAALDAALEGARAADAAAGKMTMTKADRRLMENVAQLEAQKAKAVEGGELSLGIHLRSPSSLRKVAPRIFPFVAMGKKAYALQERLRARFGEALDGIWGGGVLKRDGLLRTDEERKLFSDILILGDLHGREFSDAELAKMGAAENVRRAYRKLRSVYDHAHKAVNRQLKKWGREPMNYREGYVPHVFHQWLVVGDGEVLDSARSVRDAVERLGEFEKKGFPGKLEIKAKGHDFGGVAGLNAVTLGDVQYFALMRKVADVFALSAEEAKEFLRDVATPKNRSRFFEYAQSREGWTGWDKDMEFAARHYMNLAARFIAMDELKHNGINLFERRFGRYDSDHKGEAKYVKDYLNDCLGTPTWVEDALNATIRGSWIGRWVEDHYGDRPALVVSGNLASFTALCKLGFMNMSSGLMQLSQCVAAYAMTGEKAFAKGVRDFAGGMSPRERARIYRGAGLLENVNLASSSGYSNAAKVRGVAAKAAMMPFEWGDRTARKIAILSAYEKAISEGKNRAQAYAYAREINEAVNFDYSVADTPNVLRRAGPIGTVGLQFKKFGIKMMELTFGGKMKGAQQVRFWAPMVAFAGMFGLPGWELIRNILGALFDDFDPERVLKAWVMEQNWIPKPMRRTMLYGMMANLGVDISKRVGMGDFIPSDLGDLAGPTLSTAGRVLRALPHIFSEEGMVEALRAISPALGSYATAVRGELRDFRRGRVKYGYQGGERVARGLGFRPIREAEESDILSIIGYRDRQRQKTEQAVIDDYVRALRGVNREILPILAARLGELGISPERIIEEFKKKDIPSVQRMFQGMGVKERVRNRGLEEYLNQ
jgi:hypothetical protein